MGILPLLSSSTSLRATLGLVLSLCSTVYYREVEPFRNRLSNILVYAAQIMLLLTFGGALVVVTGSNVQTLLDLETLSEM